MAIEVKNGMPFVLVEACFGCSWVDSAHKLKLTTMANVKANDRMYMIFSDMILWINRNTIQHTNEHEIDECWNEC